MKNLLKVSLAEEETSRCRLRFLLPDQFRRDKAIRELFNYSEYSGKAIF